MNYMEHNKYPIHTLNANITAILSKIITADIPGCINNGLSNEIRFIDECSYITCPAEIVPSGLNGECYVKLSSAYCQFLWLLCDITLKTIDCNIILQECEKSGITIEDFNAEVKQILNLPKDEVRKLIQLKYPNINIDQYLDYLRGTPDITQIPELQKEIAIDFELLFELTNDSVNIEKFTQIKFTGKYTEKVNAMYCYGIAFVLLHELSHFSLGHLNKSEEENDEREADIAAFWELYGNLCELEQFTANCGMLCVMYSLLFLNPSMKGDGIHPSEELRIFELYEQIKSDNDKYALLVIHLFDIWISFNNIQSYSKKDDENTDATIRRIIEFLTTYKMSLNDK